MADDANRLQHPIDVVHLIQKALRALAVRAEREATKLDALGGLHSFNIVFHAWATNLIMQTELKREHIRGNTVTATRGGRARQAQTSYPLP